jgi:hypothetical protein
MILQRVILSVPDDPAETFSASLTRKRVYLGEKRQFCGALWYNRRNEPDSTVALPVPDVGGGTP